MLERLVKQTKDFPPIQVHSIASKAAKVLSVSPGEFSCPPSSSSISSSTSEHKVMLTVILLKKLIGKYSSCVRGFINPCLCRTVSSKLQIWMMGSSFVWQEMWFALTTSFKSNIILQSLASCMMRYLRVMHFLRGWLTII